MSRTPAAKLLALLLVLPALAGCAAPEVSETASAGDAGPAGGAAPRAMTPFTFEGVLPPSARFCSTWTGGRAEFAQPGSWRASTAVDGTGTILLDVTATWTPSTALHNRRATGSRSQ